MNNKETRWKQRFVNFEKAFLLLKKSIGIKKPSDVEKAGLIQFYEMSFELSWKMMKDYLEAEGFLVKSPRETIKQAYQIGLILEAELWMEALSDRNLTAHTYDEETANAVVNNIRTKYYGLMDNLYKSFVKKNEQ